jgi:hypothetical protein
VPERAGVVGVILAALVVICLPACQATVRVGINVAASGAGTVTVTATLDRDAASAVPDLAGMLRTADLQQAGWQIQGPTPAPGGGVTVVASRDFLTPAQAAEVIGELSGPAGPFHDLKVSRDVSRRGTTTAVNGTVDLTCGLACFGDSQLRQTLGANVGLDPAQLQEAGIDPSQILNFAVDVRLPGVPQSSNAPVQANGESQWQIKLGSKATLAMSSRIVRHSRNQVIIIVVVAAVVVVLIVVGVVTWLRRRRRRSRPEGGGAGGPRGRPGRLHAARG